MATSVTAELLRLRDAEMTITTAIRPCSTKNRTKIMFHIGNQMDVVMESTTSIPIMEPVDKANTKDMENSKAVGPLEIQSVLLYLTLSRPRELRHLLLTCPTQRLRPPTPHPIFSLPIQPMRLQRRPSPSCPKQAPVRLFQTRLPLRLTTKLFLLQISNEISFIP